MGASDTQHARGVAARLRYWGETVSHTPDGGVAEDLTAVVEVVDAAPRFGPDGETEAKLATIEVDADDAGSITDKSTFTIRSVGPYAVQRIKDQEYSWELELVYETKTTLGGIPRLDRRST